MSRNTSFTKRLLIFLVGVPGYILTMAPWMFVLTLLFMIMARYTTDGDISFDYLVLQYESVEITIANVFLLLLMSLGLWVFMAWFVKRGLLFISQKIGESEKTWQIVKVTALISGWVAVSLAAIFVFENLNPGFFLSTFLVIVAGLASFGLEYLLTRLWLHPKPKS